MLRRHTNALLQEILRSGLDPALFDAVENYDAHDHPGFDVRLRDSPLTFTIRNPEGRFEDFDYQFTEFGAGYPWTDIRPESGYVTFDQVLAVFREWVDTDIRDHLEDVALPDLWSQVNHARTMLGQVAGISSEELFSEDEKAQTRIAIQQFKLLVFKTFDPSPGEQAVVDQQLDHLANAVDRLGKFDWQGIALNTLISIGVTLSLDTEKGRILFGLFQQSLSYALHLLK